jgi:hypothetical protein
MLNGKLVQIPLLMLFFLQLGYEVAPIQECAKIFHQQ